MNRSAEAASVPTSRGDDISLDRRRRALSRYQGSRRRVKHFSHTDTGGQASHHYFLAGDTNCSTVRRLRYFVRPHAIKCHLFADATPASWRDALSRREMPSNAHIVRHGNFRNAVEI